jgi:hypothetical protein
MRNPRTEYDQGSVIELPPSKPQLASKRPRRAAEPSLTQKFFFGDFKPNSDRGRRTAFKRGLFLAAVIGVIAAGILASILLTSGFTMISIFVPVVGTIIGCVILAGITMFCVGLYKSYIRNSNKQKQIDEFTKSTPQRFTIDNDNNRTLGINNFNNFEREPSEQRDQGPTTNNFFPRGNTQNGSTQPVQNPGNHEVFDDLYDDTIIFN